ncbi:hypothetical protein Tco_0857077 [Tanacetum coccineum]|uniref:Uncharacterized protein n=1 Tax=Tanacetum coccineum TaxID=301880 RepID=A0ABQ5B564_9ASTR
MAMTIHPESKESYGDQVRRFNQGTFADKRYSLRSTDEKEKETEGHYTYPGRDKMYYDLQGYGTGGGMKRDTAKYTDGQREAYNSDIGDLLGVLLWEEKFRLPYYGLKLAEVSLIGPRNGTGNTNDHICGNHGKAPAEQEVFRRVMRTVDVSSEDVAEVWDRVASETVGLHAKSFS